MGKKNNSGDRNSGNRNSGNRNSGNQNSGNRNSGNRNSGNRNSGNRNSGNRNSGDRNSGNQNSGYFNSTEPKVRIFNSETDILKKDIVFPDYFYFDYVPVSLERIEDTSKVELGYLKTVKNEKDLKYWWKKAWQKATHEDRMKTFNLPNFDADVFEDITGLHIHDYIKKEYKFIMNDGVEYKFTTKKEMFHFINSLG